MLYSVRTEIYNEASEMKSADVENYNDLGTAMLAARGECLAFIEEDKHYNGSTDDQFLLYKTEEGYDVYFSNNTPAEDGGEYSYIVFSSYVEEV